MHKQKIIDNQSDVLALKTGQVWHYNTRNGEEASTLTINRIDSDNTHRAIYHLSIEGVNIQPPHFGLLPVTHISHVPVAENALLDSLTTLAEADPIDHIGDEGYASWKNAYESGDASVFSMPIADIVNSIERSIHTLQ